MEREKFQLPYMIQRLNTRLMVMFVSSSQALAKSIASLAKGDRDIAFATIDGDKEINALESEIDDLALSILVRTQALAGDLRLVIGALGMINDLERIGDEAVVVAERVALAAPEECSMIYSINAGMADFAQQRMNEATDIFKKQDVKAAIELCAKSDEIAQFEVKVVQEVIDSLTKSSVKASPVVAVQSIMVCRALARVSHRAVNLAEHTYFVCTGENIKHANLKQLRGVYDQ